MNNTTLAKRRVHAIAASLALTFGWVATSGHAAQNSVEPQAMARAQPTSETLSAKQQSIPLIAAFMATSDMPKLNTALNQGLDAGMTVSEAKEILVQLYAYAGFPKSLNALGEFLKVVEAANSAASRTRRGVNPPGRFPRAMNCLRSAPPTRRRFPAGQSRMQ